MKAATLSLPLVAALCFPLIGGVRIDTTDGGYRDVVVAIHPSVTPDENIIVNIKALFREASLFLHRATRGRVFFKDVTIAVPSTWPRREEAENTASNLFDGADLRVAEPNPEYGDTPYTLQPRGCGEVGEYIHITPAFLSGLNGTTSKTYGSPAFQLVHEWAHYRYGVFDEYGAAGDYRYPSLYCEFGKVRANACSVRMRFTASTKNGEPCRVYRGCKVSTKCNAKFYQNTRDPVESSIMFMPYIPGVSQFCDDSKRKHNIFAPSKQNHICQRRSTWDVISNNADFQNLGDPVAETQVQVKFQEVQQRNDSLGKVVMALDISGSMNDYERLVRLKSAATHFVRDVLPNDFLLGIVVFSSTATVTQRLTAVNDTSRTDMAKAIDHLAADGDTCIGCALKQSVQVLKEGGRTAEGDTIILMTDGNENKDPRIAAVLPELLTEKVVVNTLALGTSAEKNLENLALMTGGKAFSLSDSQANIEAAMQSAFVESTTTQLDEADRPITILDESIKLNKSKTIPIMIDPELGKDTKVVIVSGSQTNLEVHVLDPMGNTCKACSFHISNSGSKWRTVKIPSPAMPGTWNLTLTTKADTDVVNVRVTSMAVAADDHPIRLRTFLKKLDVNQALDACIFSEVSKGPHAVLRAKVLAKVLTPQKNVGQLIVELFDDGVGADVTANDGIYSAYFTQFKGNGRYSVVAEVVGDGSAIIVRGRRGSGGLPVVASPPEVSTNVAATEKTASASPEFGAEGLPFEQFVYVDEDIEVAEPLEVVGEKAPSFRRFSDGGSFQVDGAIDVSKIPPASIQDLRVADVITENGTLCVVLSWTCPGEHLDYGQASQVEIRVSTNMASFLKRFEDGVPISENDVMEGQLSPLPARTKQNVTIKIPEDVVSEAKIENRTDFYFSARVLNKDGLDSGASNIALATFEHPPPEQQQKPLASKNWGLLIGVPVAIILLAIVILTVVFGRRRTSTQKIQPEAKLHRIHYAS
uniref:Putative epithelial chloride channel protein n=1 Tax=Ixodes scapularis TaxID=6945 RepID=A0A4D5RHI9_IXOSC